MMKKLMKRLREAKRESKRSGRKLYVLTNGDRVLVTGKSISRYQIARGYWTVNAFQNGCAVY